MARIVVVGAGGFVGRNLTLRLAEDPRFEPLPLTRAGSDDEWTSAFEAADAVVNLAGVNRPEDPSQFRDNYLVAQRIAALVEGLGRPVPITHLSSVRAGEPTAYGESKREAEDRLLAFAARTGTPVAIHRAVNIFGKWCRPDYNSAVATFCHNIARDLPIHVSDASAPLRLIYIDDLIDAIVSQLAGGVETGFWEAGPIYNSTVGNVAEALRGFRADRAENMIANVGHGLLRALYATYVSYLPPQEFAYPIVSHGDPRGVFAEVLKTRDAGQFSFFTAHPGVTRGSHYHHTKTEKFLIVQGQALFRFRHMLTGETHEVSTTGEVPTVVETVPGWTHDVTNVGEGLMISMLWANELFDRQRPDTISEKV